jgi:hypothetical protein
MTRKEISKSLKLWKTVLRLEDWNIIARTVPAKQMQHEGTDNEGLNFIHPEEMYSEILLRWGATEETLVHELLHLVMDGDSELKPYDVLHERGINRIAAALMFLKGEGK